MVVESTGFFDSYDKAKAHLDAGAKRAVITAPVKDDMALTLTPNVNAGDISQFKITSNASCTTNAITPLISILAKNPGIKKAVLNTIHAYTASQGIVDKPDAKDWRRGPSRNDRHFSFQHRSGHFRRESHARNERNF